MVFNNSHASMWRGWSWLERLFSQVRCRGVHRNVARYFVQSDSHLRSPAQLFLRLAAWIKHSPEIEQSDLPSFTGFGILGLHCGKRILLERRPAPSMLAHQILRRP